MSFRKPDHRRHFSSADSRLDSAIRPPNSEFLFGRRPIQEALHAGSRSLHKLWIADKLHGVDALVQLARQRGVPVEFVPRDRLDRMVQGHHQGLVAQAAAKAYLELSDLLKKIGPTAPALLIALDEIQDPQNVGAIMRSAGFFGVQGILVPKWRSAPVGETAARASSGAIEHLNLVRIGNLAETINELKDAGFEVVGADADGAPLAAHKPSPRTVLVMGSEGEGLRRLVRERCDTLLGIPRQGKLDSLNVGAATAIFLYEFSKGRQSRA